MEKLAFRVITAIEEVELFLSKFENYVNVRLPVEYAKSSKIVGVFLQNKMVAGYMLVTQPAFRSVIFVPNATKANNSFFSKDTYEMMEVNGLWIGPSLKDPKLQLAVWFHLVADIFMARKKYVLLMRDVRNKNMERLMNMANPIPLYIGVPEIMVGDKSHEEIQVSYVSRWNLVLNSHKYWRELKNRQHRASEHAQQRLQSRTSKHSAAKYS